MLINTNKSINNEIVGEYNLAYSLFRKVDTDKNEHIDYFEYKIFHGPNNANQNESDPETLSLQTKADVYYKFLINIDINNDHRIDHEEAQIIDRLINHNDSEGFLLKTSKSQVKALNMLIRINEFYGTRVGNLDDIRNTNELFYIDSIESDLNRDLEANYASNKISATSSNQNVSYNSTLQYIQTRPRTLAPYIISKIINKYFSYEDTDTKYYADIHSAFVSLKGDCETFSFISRSILRNCNYEAAYLVSLRGFLAGGHAICVYKDNNNNLRVIDNTGLSYKKYSSIDRLLSDYGMVESYIYYEDKIGIFKALSNTDIKSKKKYAEGLIPFYRIK